MGTPVTADLAASLRANGQTGTLSDEQFLANAKAKDAKERTTAEKAAIAADRKRLIDEGKAILSKLPAATLNVLGGYLVEVCKERYDNPKAWTSKDGSKSGQLKTVKQNELAEVLSANVPELSHAGARIALFELAVQKGLVKSAWAGSAAIADNRYVEGGTAFAADSRLSAALAKLNK